MTTHALSRRLACALTVLAVAAGLSPASAAGTRYPLTLANCGATITFANPPRRVVSIGQSTTETLLSLGLADRIVGTAVWFGPVLKRYAAENAGIKRLADNDPSFEAVVDQSPDLVAAQYEWHVGPNGSVGRREQFADLGIPAYVSPADCVEKDNAVGDGVRKRPFTMALVYQEIRELAEIFDVNDRGDALIAELQRREADAVAKVAGAHIAKGVPVVFWFSSKQVNGDAFVAGKNGAPAYIMSALGARNIVETQEEWPLVGWEAIAAADPKVIVLAKMDRRRFPADSIDAKLNFLATDPVVSQLPAVKDRHFVVMDAQDMNPSIRTIDGIEALADGIRALGPSN